MEAKIINDRKCFVYRKEDQERIDTIGLRMMEQNEIQGFLPFKYVRQGRRSISAMRQGREKLWRNGWRARSPEGMS